MKFKIGLSQFPVKYHNTKQDWVENLEKWFKYNKNKNSQILVFPEYGSMDLISLLSKKVQKSIIAQLHEVQVFHNFFLNTFIELSKKYSVYTIAPSFPLKLGKKYFNRTYFINPIGKCDFQDKIHMTRFENELWSVSGSETELKIFETDFGKIGIQTCLDIEFPWASGLLSQKGVYTIFAPACTDSMAGAHRVQVGARARALENQLYVGVSHTVGKSNWSSALDINYGSAALFSTSDRTFPDDGIIAIGKQNMPSLVVAEVDQDKIKNVRKKGQVFNYSLSYKYPWKNINKKAFDIKSISM